MYNCNKYHAKKEWIFRMLEAPQTRPVLVVLRIRPHSHPTPKGGAIAP